MSARFSDAQMRRYSRQLLLPAVGGHGQSRLLAAEVAVDVDSVGGRIAALLLAAAGIGRVVLCGALDRPLTIGDVGFPIGARDVGATLGDAMGAAIAARNPDVAVVRSAAQPDGRLVLDGATPSLASAFARAGAAASAIVHAIATGAAPGAIVHAIATGGSR